MDLFYVTFRVELINKHDDYTIQSLLKSLSTVALNASLVYCLYLLQLTVRRDPGYKINTNNVILITVVGTYLLHFVRFKL